MWVKTWLRSGSWLCVLQRAVCNDVCVITKCPSVGKRSYRSFLRADASPVRFFGHTVQSLQLAAHADTRTSVLHALMKSYLAVLNDSASESSPSPCLPLCAISRNANLSLNSLNDLFSSRTPTHSYSLRSLCLTNGHRYINQE